MTKPTTNDLIDLSGPENKPNAPLVQQPRGLSVPTPKPPADMIATPGVEDSAERAAQRARLIALVRKQQEELPIAAADQAFRGAVVGGLSGLACVLLRGLFTSGPSAPPDEEYDDE